jgi:hypothetical protein
MEATTMPSLLPQLKPPFRTPQGDCMESQGIENETGIAARKQMLRKFGYKL